MPIKPENRARYPKDWKQIRQRIMARADNRCEHEGCGAQHYDVGFWESGRWIRLLSCASYKIAKDYAAEEHFARYGFEDGDVKIIVIVLTIAHLDHTPENCADENLRALCQRHHLAYDQMHHRATAQATRRARMAAGDLFECGSLTTNSLR